MHAFVGIGEFGWAGVDYGGAVVHGEVHGGAGVDDAVDVGDREGDVAGHGGAHIAGAGGAVQVEGVAVAAVDGGKDHGGAVQDDAQVAEQAGVEDGVQVGAVGAAPLLGPGEAAARGG